MPSSPADNLVNGPIAANAATVLLDVTRHATATVTLTGTWVGTVQFEVTTDNVTWVGIPVSPIAGGALVTSATANGTWSVNVSAYDSLRLRASAWTSGSATVAVRASAAGGSVPVLTPGSIAFANASGALTQDNANFKRDPTTGALSIFDRSGSELFATTNFLSNKVGLTMGSFGSPFAGNGPVAKISKVEQISAATQPNPADASNTAFVVMSQGLAANTPQTSAIWGFADNAGTTVGADAAGLIGQGWIAGSTAVGYGMGAYLEGRRTAGTTLGHCYGAEMTSWNDAAAPVFSSTGASDSMGLWAVARTSAGFDSAAGMQLYGQNSGVDAKFLYGYVANTGAIRTSTFADFSSSVTSHDIQGTHNYGIDLSGTFANSAIRAGGAPGSSFVDIFPPSATTAMTIRNATGGSTAFVIRNSAASSVLFVNDGGTTFNSNAGFTNQGLVGENFIVKYSEELLTLSTGAATTDTVGNLLPANSLILGVSVRVTTAITTAASFSVGDATTAARFASGVAVALNTTANGISQANGGVAAGAGMMQTAAAKVRITSNVTPGAGVVRITVAYMQFSAPTS